MGMVSGDTVGMVSLMDRNHTIPRFVLGMGLFASRSHPLRCSLPCFGLEVLAGSLEGFMVCVAVHALV